MHITSFFDLNQSTAFFSGKGFTSNIEVFWTYEPRSQDYFVVSDISVALITYAQSKSSSSWLQGCKGVCLQDSFSLPSDSLMQHWTWLKETRVRCQKKTILFGNFSQTSDPHPHPPLLGTPYPKKILVFILHFRTLGTFLVFSKKLKICQYFYI